MNIYGYVKTNQLDFEELPFSSVDALVISWVAYFDFDYIQDRLPIAFKELRNINYYHKLEPYKAAFLAKASRKIMRALVNSNRSFALIDRSSSLTITSRSRSLPAHSISIL